MSTSVLARWLQLRRHHYASLTVLLARPRGGICGPLGERCQAWIEKYLREVLLCLARGVENAERHLSLVDIQTDGACHNHSLRLQYVDTNPAAPDVLYEDASGGNVATSYEYDVQDH